MQYILDTYAWIEYFIGSKKGEAVRDLIKSNKNTLFTIENCISELVQWCLEENINISKVLNIVRINSEIISVDLDDWIEAVKIKFHKRREIKDFGLMDAIILVKQEKFNCKIITGDKHFKNLSDVLFLD